MGGKVSEAGELAARQHGCATRQQLLAAGLSGRQIDRRIESGRLHVVHRGVYRVGHAAPSTLAAYTAAVLACGEGAVLSGRAAGYLHRLLKGYAPSPEVTTTSHRKVPGVITHRRTLAPEDKGAAKGIATTRIARTLVDLASTLTQPQLMGAAHQAWVLHQVGAPQVEAALARHANAKGASTLRAIVCGDARITLSELERAFLRLLKTQGLPLPETNVAAGGRTVDCRWPAFRVTVELDGFKFHATRRAWERDRVREREAYARGDQFRRYPWSDVTGDSRAMLRELRSLLAATSSFSSS